MTVCFFSENIILASVLVLTLSVNVACSSSPPACPSFSKAWPSPMWTSGHIATAADAKYQMVMHGGDHGLIFIWTVHLDTDCISMPNQNRANPSFVSTRPTLSKYIGSLEFWLLVWLHHTDQRLAQQCFQFLFFPSLASVLFLRYSQPLISKIIRF